MNDRQFVDTNILIYAFDSSAGLKHRQAVELVEMLWGSRLGCLSIQVLQEFHVTATKKLRMPVAESLRHLRRFQLWEIHCPGAADVLEAVQLQQVLPVSFWDAMILRSAAQLACGMLWSEDLNPGQTYGSVTVRSPFDPAPPSHSHRRGRRG